MTEDALRKDGHEIVEFNPPSPYEALRLSSSLPCADGLETVVSLNRPGEWIDRGVAEMRFYNNLPRAVNYVYCRWTKYLRCDRIWAGLPQSWYHRNMYEYWSLIAKCDAYKNDFFKYWNQTEVDFVTSPPNATPDVPHDGMRTKMHGLPVGIQVIERRLKEENLLALMGRVAGALEDDKFPLLKVN